MNLTPPTSAVTTHVLDATAGRPARGIPVTLARHTGNGWQPLAHSVTDADGRIRDFGTPRLLAGVYRLEFVTAAYLGPAARGTFFPEISVSFEVNDPFAHYHVPLLLSPHSYTTYRGS